ncbi:MAG TPA: outer membrane beta-barrel protein [Candidatus Paceibacterota bacterium]|nr:outer membrane beta-barrel protein [Candidatus Paceibacterota bacterium]
MKISKWTQVLLGAGLISAPALAQAQVSNAVLTAVSSTTLSGYVDTSAVWKFGTGNANMPGRVYDGADSQDGFNLNVVSLSLTKPLDEGEWSSGYNVQMLFGPYATKRGTRSIIGAGGDFAINEAVVLLRVPVGNGIDFKVGQFGTYNGYEAFDTYKNPNWSRSYGFYVESSAHTGISGSYKFNDVVSVMAGVGNIAGFNNQADAKSSIESKKAYLGMITLTAPESLGFLKGGTLSAGYTVGDSAPAGVANVSGTPNAGRWNQGNFYVGGAIPLPVSGLSLGVAYDYTHGMIFEKSYAEAIAGYLTWQATEKLKVNGRVDYGWGSDGTFGYTSVDAKNELISLTGTFDYSLWKNVITRAELRWDHALTNDKPFGGTVSGSPDAENAVSLAMNVIYQF